MQQNNRMNDSASGKWLPYNMNGTQHDCRNQAQQTETKKQETMVVVNERLGQLTLEELNVRNQELEARVKRLESMLIGVKKWISSSQISIVRIVAKK